MCISTPKLHCTEVGLCIFTLKLQSTEVGLCSFGAFSPCFQGITAFSLVFSQSIGRIGIF